MTYKPKGVYRKFQQQAKRARIVQDNKNFSELRSLRLANSKIVRKNIRLLEEISKLKKENEEFMIKYAPFRRKKDDGKIKLKKLLCDDCIQTVEDVRIFYKNLRDKGGINFEDRIAAKKQQIEDQRTKLMELGQVRLRMIDEKGPNLSKIVLNTIKEDEDICRDEIKYLEKLVLRLETNQSRTTLEYLKGRREIINLKNLRIRDDDSNSHLVKIINQQSIVNSVFTPILQEFQEFL